MSDVKRFAWNDHEGGWCDEHLDRFGPFEVVVRASDYDRDIAALRELKDAVIEWYCAIEIQRMTGASDPRKAAEESLHELGRRLSDADGEQHG